MAYYDSVGDPFLSARCHYMNGVGYYEMDSVVPACKEYMKALEIVETHFEEKELVEYKAKFLALAYTRLCGLYSDQYLHEQAIYFGKQALSYYNKYDAEHVHVAWIMNNIGIHYQAMEQLDSARYYFEKVLELIPDTNNIAYRDAVTAMALSSYFRVGNPKVTLEHLLRLLALSESNNEYLSRCLAVGYVFFKEQQYDSAWKYLNMVFNETTAIDWKKQSAEWLVNVSREQGKDDESLMYVNYLAPFANQEENNSVLKSKLTKLHTDYTLDRLGRQHQKKTFVGLKRVTILIAFLILVILIFVLLYQKNKRRKQDLEVQIEEERRLHELKQKALSGRLKKSNENVRKALKRVEEQKETNKQTKTNEPIDIGLSLNRYEVFKQTSICQEVYDKVEQLHHDKKKTLKTNMDVTSYKSFALSATQLVLLSKTADEHFPELFDSLKKQFPSLNQKDWFVCLLYLMQLDKLSICVLLQEPYHTCRRHTLKLEQAFLCKHDLSVFMIGCIIHKKH